MVKGEIPGSERSGASPVSKRGDSEAIGHQVFIVEDICDHRDCFDSEHASPY